MWRSALHARLQACRAVSRTWICEEVWADSLACTSAGPPHKLSDRVTRSSPLSRGAVSAVLAALRLADLQGFDPQHDNAVAAGSFCFSPPGAPPQQVGDRMHHR